MIEHWALLSMLLGAAIFLLAGALSPIESFAWWAGWLDEDPASFPERDAEAFDGGKEGRFFAVYLAGIDSIAGDKTTRRTERFLTLIEAAAPEVTIVSDVFPYAPSGRPLLAGPRLFLKTWRALYRLKLRRRSSILSNIINLRNLYQVLVSADHRYGPIFNAGAAHVILDALLRAGYDMEKVPPICIIGYSGGGQIAAASAEFLKAATGARITVISVGGIIASTPGVAALDMLHHLYGEKDSVQRLGAIMFPERWGVFPYSHWNLAKAQGRIQARCIGAMGHDRVGGYLGEGVDEDGEPFIRKTATAVAEVLKAETAAISACAQL